MRIFFGIFFVLMLYVSVYFLFYVVKMLDVIICSFYAFFDLFEQD